MKSHGVGIVASLKGLCFMSEMLSNKPNLVLVLCVLNKDALNPALISHSKNMRCLFEIKGHNGLPHLVNMFLRGLADRNGAPQCK